MEPRVLCVGVATLDVIQRVAQLPQPNTKTVSLGTLMQSGGPATNAAITARALGAHVTLASFFGPSAVADLVRRDIESMGVHVVDLAPVDTTWEPAVATVLITESTGDRTIVSLGAVGAPEDPVPTPDLTDVDVVLCDGHHLEACIAVVAAAEARGIPVLVDGGSWKTGFERLLTHSTAILMSADFTVPSSNEPVLDAVRALGPAFAARSAGSQALTYASAETRGEIAVDFVDVVDTLGAGDVLHGAWAAYVAQHGITSATMADGLRFSAQIATQSCRFAGARGWIAETSS